MEFTTEFKKSVLTGYAKFLANLGIMTDADGLTYVLEGGTWLPMTMAKRRLVLPTEDWLRDPNWETTIPFHPFSEHLQKGKSIVLEKTTRALNLRLNQIISQLMLTKIKFAADTESHASASAAQKEFLRLLPDINAKTTFNDFKKFIMGHVDGSAEKSFISIYLKRGGELAGNTYSRTAIVTSPARKAAGSAEPVIFDYKFSSKRNRDYLLILLDEILPKLQTDIGYSVGSNAPIAPYFVTLATAYQDIMTDLNRQLEVFKDINPDLAPLIADMSWMEIVENSKDALSQIRALRDNTGSDEDGDVRIQSDITSREREREAARDKREASKSSRNQYAERSESTRKEERYESRHERDERGRRDERERDEPTGWRRVAERREDDRYDRERGRSGRRDRDSYRDYRDERDRRDDYRSRDRDRDYDDRDRGRDRDDYRDRGRDRDDRNLTASGIPRDVGTPLGRRRY